MVLSAHIFSAHTFDDAFSIGGKQIFSAVNNFYQFNNSLSSPLLLAMPAPKIGFTVKENEGGSLIHRLDSFDVRSLHTKERGFSTIDSILLNPLATPPSRYLSVGKY
jgi:hypothetical protein